MAIATYQAPDCDPCGRAELQPVFGNAVGASETHCPTACDSGVAPAIPLRLQPDGIPWTIDLYFLQVLGPGDTPAPVDHYLNPVFQRLAMLEDLVIYATTPLSNLVDPSTNDITREGQGTVVGFAPQDGDIFLVRLENNTPYMFRVTAAELVNAFSNDTFRITYKAFNVVQDFDALYTDLSHKVMDFDRYKFNLSSWLQGGSAFLNAEQVTQAATKSSLYQTLVNDWLQFYDPDSATFVAKTEQGRVYDPNVTETMRRLLPLTGVKNTYYWNVSLWQREIPSYFPRFIRTPYTHQNQFSFFRLFRRHQLGADFANSHIRHTTVEWMVKDVPTSLPEAFVDIPELTLFQDGYIVSAAYGTSDPNKPIFDQLLEGIYAKTISPALLQQAYDAYLAQSLANRYWLLPLLLLALTGEVICPT